MNQQLITLLTVILPFSFAIVFIPTAIAQVIYLIVTKHKAKQTKLLYESFIEIASAPYLELWQRYKLIYRCFESFGFKVSNVIKYNDKLQVYVNQEFVGEVLLPSEWN